MTFIVSQLDCSLDRCKKVPALIFLSGRRNVLSPHTFLNGCSFEIAVEWNPISSKVIYGETYIYGVAYIYGDVCLFMGSLLEVYIYGKSIVMGKSIFMGKLYLWRSKYLWVSLYL